MSDGAWGKIRDLEVEIELFETKLQEAEERLKEKDIVIKGLIENRDKYWKERCQFKAKLSQYRDISEAVRKIQITHALDKGYDDKDDCACMTCKIPIPTEGERMDEVKDEECPDCGSPIEDSGNCADVGNNNCQYLSSNVKHTSLSHIEVMRLLYQGGLVANYSICAGCYSKSINKEEERYCREGIWDERRINAKVKTVGLTNNYCRHYNIVEEG